MTRLDGEALVLVLNQLSTAKDHAACGMVSKAWAQASTCTHPQEIRLQHLYRDDVADFKHAMHHIRWLQALQQQGRLQNMQKAALLDNFSSHDNGKQDPSSISQGFLALAGSWQLCKCVLRGTFCLSTAAALLPTTLLALELWPESAPDVTWLSSFQRFARLQVLKLGVGISNHVSEFPGEDILEFELVLDAAIPSLESFAVLDRLHITILDGCNVGDCLPRVRRASFRLAANAEALQLAQEILEVQSLLDLRLDLEDGSGQRTTLTVPMAGSLQNLIFCGPARTPKVSVVIEKAGLGYSCSRVSNVSSADVDAVYEFDCRPEMTYLPLM